MFKRLAMLAVVAAVALVPATSAQARPLPNPQPIDLCVVKWIKSPSQSSSTQMPPGPDNFDVQNQYADSGQDDGTVDFDDMTYDGCA
jgi:hypothetical protein